VRLFSLPVILVSAGVLAQDHHPYAEMELRGIKGLSAERVADLRAGRGMGLALPAELNGYPGPAHVLENADALRLTADQRARTQALFYATKAEAVAIGEQLFEQMRKLDRLFADRRIEASSLQSITREIGLTEARLRQTHLKYHLAMVGVLSQSRVEAYRKIRSYWDKRDDAQSPQHYE
jgi:hypothetical protein